MVAIGELLLLSMMLAKAPVRMRFQRSRLKPNRRGRSFQGRVQNDRWQSAERQKPEA
jgi:hypothetical protein